MPKPEPLLDSNRNATVTYRSPTHIVVRLGSGILMAMGLLAFIGIFLRWTQTGHITFTVVMGVLIGGTLAISGFAMACCSTGSTILPEERAVQTWASAFGFLFGRQRHAVDEQFAVAVDRDFVVDSPGGQPKPRFNVVLVTGGGEKVELICVWVEAQAWRMAGEISRLLRVPLDDAR